MGEIDIFGAVMVVFYSPILFWFVMVSSINYTQQEKETLRLNVLSTRTALVLPIYATIIYVSLLVPQAYDVLEIFITFFEGANIQTFYTLLVVNMNGPVNTVDHMDNLDGEFCLNAKCGCLCCKCHTDKYQFYRSATWWMFHAWWTRTLLIIISTICHFIPGRVATIIFLVCSVASFVILMSAVIRLINLYDYIYESTVNINGLMKLFMIKTTISLLVILSLIAQFIAEFYGGIRAPNDEYQPTAGVALWYTTRAWCALILIIFCVYCIAMFPVYIKKIGPSPFQSTYNAYDFDKFTSFLSYNLALLNYFDILGLLNYPKGVMPKKSIEQQQIRDSATNAGNDSRVLITAGV